DQPYPNHNGGALAFGPDGLLYVSLGDGGSGGDPQNHGQSLDTLLGKILRIDIDNASDGREYGIPPTNPFAAGGGEPEIWLHGLGNPWRLSFDPATGNLGIGDVGQNVREEVALDPAGVGGLNYGWRITEGAICYQSAECDTTGITAPITDYAHDLGCTI